MREVLVRKGKKEYRIAIDKYKIFVGNNYQEKNDIIRTLLRTFKNYKPSEYASEYNNIAEVKVDGHTIRNKETFVYHVNKYYSIIEDAKMTTQSLLLKYYEVRLNSIDYIDTINTINILFESLANEISFNTDLLSVFDSITSKQLIKLMTTYYNEEDFIKDEYDLTIEEIILFQLDILKYISSNNKTIKDIIICLEVPELTNNIYEKIKSIHNAMVLVFADELSINIESVKDIYICNRINVDCANEEEKYSLICDNQYCLLSLKEVDEMIIDYVKGVVKDGFINKIL